MPARNSPVRYGYVAQALHWIIVGLLVVQVTLGRIADELPLGLEKLRSLWTSRTPTGSFFFIMYM